MKKIEKIKHIICLLLVCLFYNAAWSGTIVYPRRVTTALVETGKSFTVWYAADRNETIQLVELQAPYNTLYPSVHMAAGKWESDVDSHNTYNRRIMLTIPEDAPQIATTSY